MNKTAGGKNVPKAPGKRYTIPVLCDTTQDAPGTFIFHEGSATVDERLTTLTSVGQLFLIQGNNNASYFKCCTPPQKNKRLQENHRLFIFCFCLWLLDFASPGLIRQLDEPVGVGSCGRRSSRGPKHSRIRLQSPRLGYFC